MKHFKFILGLIAISGAALAIYFVLTSDIALVAQPKGIIAQKQLDVIVRHILLMLVIVVPMYILLYWTAWKYRAKNAKPKRDLEHSSGVWGEIVLWGFPSVIVAVMAVMTWKSTHELDPYQPIKSDVKPLAIQVVALDWKWLFIYPEQGIATVNYVQIPAGTPIALSLSADGSPMNSFWVPQLSGQIYAMTGMATPLHFMADEPGVYAGRAAEINGRGLADMTFVVKSTTQSDFDAWVDSVKQSPLKLTDSIYQELAQPSENHPVAVYSYVENDLFNKIMMKYMHP